MMVTTSSLTENDLTFAAVPNVASVARRVRRERTSQSISSRLRSIAEDGAFVEMQARRLSLPLIANERCGSWYVPPDLKVGSVYFKSTDGHHTQWSFSLRRLNLHLLPVIGEHGGCIIVDATRRGKHAPDALAKTIPIWCAVMNTLLFPEQHAYSTVKLHESLVGLSEQAQIKARMSTFVQQARSLNLDLDHLRRTIQRPIEPLCIVRSVSSATLDLANGESSQTNTVYLCMASEFNSLSEDNGYVQGAGDDSESWAQGLSPETFWTHRDELLETSEKDLPASISQICARHAPAAVAASKPTQVKKYPLVHVGSSEAVLEALGNYNKITLSTETDEAARATSGDGKHSLQLKCANGKLGSRDLRRELHKVPRFLEKQEQQIPLLIRCQTGKDLSIGVALAVVCLYGHESGDMTYATPNSKIVDKTIVKRRLADITSSISSASPSRATLTAVNSFLMQER